MSIRFKCQDCLNTLTVPDEHAGKKAKCPSCNGINQIPADSISPLAGSSSVPTNVGSENVSSNPFEKHVAPPLPAATPMGLASQYEMNHAYQKPHRGALILTLGILSLFCNLMLIPSILAWAFGSSDLKEMKAGRMDASGYGMTQAGMIIGIISTCLFLVGILLYVIFFLFVIAAGAAGI